MKSIEQKLDFLGGYPESRKFDEDEAKFLLHWLETQHIRALLDPSRLSAASPDWDAEADEYCQGLGVPRLLLPSECGVLTTCDYLLSFAVQRKYSEKHGTGKSGDVRKQEKAEKGEGPAPTGLLEQQIPQVQECVAALGGPKLPPHPSEDEVLSALRYLAAVANGEVPTGSLEFDIPTGVPETDATSRIRSGIAALRGLHVESLRNQQTEYNQILGRLRDLVISPQKSVKSSKNR
eukprot:GHVU01029963.1.p1 GENE.GHVU01029963.1~~GHVU01029963.1.p1  ORF type:complete len:235 (+),score=29.58 GHVU01029963.1:42-746(+)